MSSEPKKTPEAEPADTRERLIEAGMATFADHGYADASIRQICARAGANPAAVNYHFGDKKRFYAEVLATCHMRAVERRPMPRLEQFKGRPEGRPEEAFRAWLRWVLELLMVDGAGPLGRLMAREMADPTQALDELVRRSMMPMMKNLRSILSALLPDDLAPEIFQMCLFSTMGQCLFYRHSRPAFESMARLVASGDIPAVHAPVEVDLDRLADHIASFSLAGMHSVIAQHRRGEGVDADAKGISP